VCRPVSKMAAQVPMADLAPAMVQRAIATALSGRRGPVVLTLPLDVSSARIHAPSVVADVSVAHGVEGPAMRAAVAEVARSLVGDAGALLGEILERVPSTPRHMRSFGVQRFADPKTAKNGKNGLITPMRALFELQSRMPSTTMYTCDIGEHLLFGTHYLHADD